MDSNVRSRVKDGLTAVIRYRTRATVTLNLLDITIGGCLVEARGWSARKGDHVTVRLPGLEGIGAEVVWNEDQRAGLAFDEPLYGPVLERMLV